MLDPASGVSRRMEFENSTLKPPMDEKRDTRRRFEQWAGNPACQANTISAVHGIQMADVARSEGATSIMGQSPFAIARGVTFERSLFRDNAAELRSALEENGVLPADSLGFNDLRLRRNGGPMRDLDAAREATIELLRKLSNERGELRPTIVASPTVLIPSGVMLPEALLVIDLLAVDYAAEGVTITVGEIKTYPDRGGHTDSHELATARAQCGVYVHALRMVLGQLGLERKVTVADHGFLVLSRPGFNKPSVRAGEDFRYQAWRAQRGFVQLEAAAKNLPPFDHNEDPAERIRAVREAATAYDSSCVTFCDRAPICFRAALEAENPAILGHDVARFLGNIPLGRAMQLMDGAVARNEAEEDLATRLSEES
jgi:hypothetical protein